MTILVPFVVVFAVWISVVALVWIARGRSHRLPEPSQGRHRLEDAREDALHMGPIIAERNADADAAQAHMAAAVRVETGQ